MNLVIRELTLPPNQPKHYSNLGHKQKKQHQRYKIIFKTSSGLHAQKYKIIWELSVLPRKIQKNDLCFFQAPTVS